LIDTKSGTRWTLSATASAAWRLCDGQRTLAEMSDILRQSRENIKEFCQQFEALGLLRANTYMRLALIESVSYRTSSPNPFSFQSAGLGNGPRRRPSPRGNSGPG